MKFIHLSDLHIGKRVHDFSMLEDQRFILRAILAVVDDEHPDAILIAGDVYDKSVPSAEAVEMLDEFLVQLSTRGIPTFLISGNHDSPERLSFGGRLMEGSGVYISPVYNGRVEPHILTDAQGEVAVYLLPFIKPAHVRAAFPDAAVETCTDALRVAVEHMAPDPSRRNVLVAHQFVTGAVRSESEEISVGGADNVDASVFAGFDYVALGHIHGPQNIGGERIRYCGTPLKYSASEVGHEKSVTVAELGACGDLSVRTVPLVPLRDMMAIQGTYDELTLRAFYEHLNHDTDYVHITLTDEEDIPDAVGKLRVIYPHLMTLKYENTRTRTAAEITGAEHIEDKSPLALFAELYESQNGAPMSEEQRAYVCALMEEIQEVNV